jgi:hypothetical protein
MMGAIKHVIVSAIAAAVGGYLAMTTLLMGGSKLLLSGCLP